MCYVSYDKFPRTSVTEVLNLIITLNRLHVTKNFEAGFDSNGFAVHWIETR